MNAFTLYIKSWFTGIASLATGMKISLTTLFRKKVTECYPENRDTLVISDRFRAELIMPHNENNEHACTACGLCMLSCPNGTLNVVYETVTTPEGKSRKVLQRYEYYLGQCTFCNLCVMACPSNAIQFSKQFELAVFHPEALHKTLNRPGSKLRTPPSKPTPVTNPVA